MAIEHTDYSSMARDSIGLEGWLVLAILSCLIFIRLVLLVRRGFRAGEIRRLRYWRSWFIWTIVILLIVYWVWGLYPDPRFRLSKLRGLTPAQVIRRLGKPDDIRHTAKPGSGADVSLLDYDYRSFYRIGGFSYGIIFEDGKVRYVEVGSK